MAAVCLRFQGLVSATVNRTAGFILPFKTPTRSIHKSHRVWGEVQTKSQPGGQVYEDVEYIPTKKAKNPMKTVGIAWAIGFPSGIILFLLTKREVDKNRLKQLKVRQKMKASNEGVYERERYKASSLVTEGLTGTKT
ncbi:probable hydrolase PNKD [Anolis carolinensis]|uniref:probable hydrolase PNKD n=1 Tax=Anolis carolinensis TaxID=28377 RepID=UPI0004628AA4|nr:PREDICTED: probable hydrolase PNKD [Anolis carolinensis]|eukprot:XP_008108490.1 PREDICTED: probable hydrolase PNKD [Anolis carolinensis]